MDSRIATRGIAGRLATINQHRMEASPVVLCASWYRSMGVSPTTRYVAAARMVPYRTIELAIPMSVAMNDVISNAVSSNLCD